MCNYVRNRWLHSLLFCVYIYVPRYLKQQLVVNDAEVAKLSNVRKIKDVNSRDINISNNVLLVSSLILLSQEILPALTEYCNHLTGKYCVVNSR
jgi:hypothetical protein